MKAVAAALITLVAAFTVFVTQVFVSGNDTQQVGKLFQLMSMGMPANESVVQFDGVYTGVAGNEQHGAYDGDVARSFYNLATEFYEYGWGDSFHFGVRKQGQSHSACIANSQSFLAQKLRVNDMDRVLDMGCGIGGPMRSVVRATGANVTGLTINEHQVARGREITRKQTPWMQKRCHFSVQDYLDVKGLEENAYDAAYYMESSLHCEDRSKTFKEAFRLLKPGGRLVALEYVTLDGWKPEDPEQQELMKLHLHGNGCARTPTIEEDLAMFRSAGFEVQEHFDLMAYQAEIFGEDAWPWWADLQMNWPTPSQVLLPAHPIVRHTLPYILGPLASIGLVPKDVPAAAELLNKGGDGLSGLGKLGAITPQYYVGAIKPAK